MYLVGAAHPHKDDARRILERTIAEKTRLVTDAEVFQEILHRYVAIDRKDAIKPAFDALQGVVEEIYSIEFEDVERARTLLLSRGRLSARDSLHLALMKRNGISRILTFDSGFDGLHGIERIFH